MKTITKTLCTGIKTVHSQEGTIKVYYDLKEVFNQKLIK